MLADWTPASENNVDESKPGVAEIQVSEAGKLVGLLDDLSRRLKKLETVTSTMAAEKRRNSGRARTNDNCAPKAQCAPTVRAKSFTPTVNAQVCYYHQTFGDKARLCSEPCSYYKTMGQREIANIESYIRNASSMI